ncbi:hypothetical protein [Streptomyces sp. NRRL B-24484]|uniref:hypothetical protein n=1 Tax=Streptomyces sp. NRRL B-24484 TaxID=1463833 RepID=UPI0004C0BA7C|nr:hypothetical protein [Streptomyces sp. NRRL B-24484]
MAYGGDVLAGNGPRKAGGGGLTAIGALLLVYVAIFAIATVISIVQGNFAYLIRMADRNAELPALAVAGYFTPLAVTLVSTSVLAVLAFRGVTWVRPAAAVLLLVTTLSASGQDLFVQLTNRRLNGFLDLPFDTMFIVLQPYLALVVAVAVAVVAIATRAPRPGPGGTFVPPPYPPTMPPPALPADRPGSAP